MSFFLDAKSKFDNFTSSIKKEIESIAQTIDQERHSHTTLGEECHALHLHTRSNRFHSFAPIRSNGNEAKWYVDGCGYMWAVSVAIEQARESIWILDWWLSPELYLRRPPTENENYRIDRMLLAAAERGVKVNVIVYKEVAAILTCLSHVPLDPGFPLTHTSQYVLSILRKLSNFIQISRSLDIPITHLVAR
jgi:phospholipase D1/2